MKHKTNYRWWVLCGLLATMILTSCSPANTQAADLLRSDVERAAPAAPAADLDELVRGNNAFAWNLYQQWRGEAGNLFYSPYSISLALAMTYAGARGDTERAMREVLQFTLPGGSLHPAFNQLDQEFSGRGEEASSGDGKTFELSIANSLWGQKDYEFLDAFLDLLAENYGAGLRLTDFMKDPEAARVAINDWVSDRTKEKIKDLIARGLIDEDTRLVLANAIYFKASWLEPFEASLTEDAPFYLLDGGQVTVPMMSMSHTARLRYAQGDGYQAIQLPYDGDEVAMTIMLPDAGSFERFEAGLDAERMDAILGSLDYEEVALRMPKFGYESSFEMGKTLMDMGMAVAFGGDADFSGMDGTRRLAISQVVHKAFVAVDEAGTEAAAATAVIMREMAAPTTPVQLAVDRPFIFLIHDTDTGSTLFVGRVINPTS